MMDSFGSTLRQDAERIQAIHATIRKRLRRIPDMSAMESSDLAGLSNVMAQLEYMISKYQEKRDIRRMLEGIQDVMNNAAEGITAIDDEISELSVNSKESCRRIAESPLGIRDAPDPDDAESIRRILAQTSQ